MTIQVVILAAGQGKRMNSTLPKVLHKLAGKSLLGHVVDTALAVSPDTMPIVVYGHGGEKVLAEFPDKTLHFVNQSKQAGTGHAVLQAMPQIADSQRVLVLYGDVPLISTDTLHRLVEQTPEDAVGMITANFANPTGYGRIKRDASGQVTGIVEEKDATDTERKITEVNSGIYLVPARRLKAWLPALEPHNAQNEYYLTDIIPMAVAEKMTVITVQPSFIEEISGVNNRVQQMQLERAYQRKAAHDLMLAGVTIMDPERLDIRGEVKAGRDVILDVNVILEGNVTLGDGTTVGANTIVRDSVIGNNVIVKSHSVVDGATVADDCIVGPFARLRPGTELDTSAHVGNFVEVKKSVIGQGSKVNHLTYIGDTEIGKNVNVGAGTITCNYDGVRKHKTIIKDDAFIGSGSQLVAPVEIGEGATIGAGSTITQNAPAWQLTLTRSGQHTSTKWTRPDKKEKVKSE